MRIAVDEPTAAEFKTLYDETGWSDRSEDDFAAALAGTWRTVTARDADGTLLGIGRLISDGVLHAFVTEMIVRGDRRGQGIGERLLAELVASAHAAGVTDVQLFAARGRRPFYERAGFVARPDDAPGMGFAR